MKLEQDLENIKQHIRVALEDILKSYSGARIDRMAAIDEVIKYIFFYEKDSLDRVDPNRYEAYYHLLGKAVAIAQGWKQNMAEEVKDPDETSSSIIRYIEKTYGIKYEDYAGV